MKVLFGTKFSSNLIDYYKKELPQSVDFITPDNYDEKSILELAPEVEVFIHYTVSKEFLEKAKNLKHIQVPWTGSERMNFELLKQYPNITVSNSHSNSLTIAEHAVALLLAVAKQLSYRDSLMRKGDWTPRYEHGMFSHSLIGKTVGIVGYGAIGQKSAKMLKNGFNMKVSAVKRNSMNYPEDGIFDFLGGMEDLSKVLKESDFIIIALPLTPDTKGIIGQEEFKIMKEGAVIVNIARGPIIDEQALYENLKTKKVSAGIDVWYNYPERGVDFTNTDERKPVYQNYPFHELDNIIMSPHSAFKVKDIGLKTAEDILENLKLLSEGKKPKNLLNIEYGY
ncbi:MAG: 2-hydroxyacid dehydrogenase [Candidatus Thorarchaeota archaeon]